MRPNAVAPANFVQLLHHRQRRLFLAIERHRHSRFKSQCDRFDFVGRFLRRNGHAKIDQLHAINRQILELSCLVANVQAVFVARIRLGHTRLHRNFLLLTKRDHLFAPWKPLAEFFDTPRRDHMRSRG